MTAPPVRRVSAGAAGYVAVVALGLTGAAATWWPPGAAWTVFQGALLAHVVVGALLCVPLFLLLRGHARSSPDDRARRTGAWTVAALAVVAWVTVAF